MTDAPRRRLAERLEAPAGAREVGERARELRGLGAGDDARRQRGRGVRDVVGARHGQRDLHARPREPRAARVQLDLRRAEERRVDDPGAVEERLGLGRVGDDDPQAVAQERRERPLELDGATRTSCDGRARCSSRARSRARARRNERSDSSASTTSQSPVPQPAFVPVVRSSPPMTYDGSQPARMSACAAIDAVVVLPCVPAIAIVRRSRDSSPSSSPRWISRRPRSRPAARSGFDGADRRRDDELDVARARDVRGVMADPRIDPRGADAREIRRVGAIGARHGRAQLAAR